MRYLCLIYLDEQELASMPPADVSDLNQAHWDVNEGLKAAGHFRAAEALGPANTTQTVKVRRGKMLVRDGPFVEAKEMVAGFYFIEADNIQQATEIAARIPSCAIGTIEVRPCRQLEVEGGVSHWGDE
jgi:hypothetical protein